MGWARFRVLVSVAVFAVAATPSAAADLDLIAQRAYLWTSEEGEITSPRLGQVVTLTVDWITTGSGETVPGLGIRALMDDLVVCQGNFPVDFPHEYATQCNLDGKRWHAHAAMGVGLPQRAGGAG